MTISLGAAGAAGLTAKQALLLGSVAVVALGGGGVMVWRSLSDTKPTPKAASVDEAKLAAKGEEQRARTAAAAQRLKQQDLGSGYQFDEQGNLLGAATDGDLPQNRAFADTPAGPPRAEIGAWIQHNNGPDMESAPEPASQHLGGRAPEDENAPAADHSDVHTSTVPDRTPMLGYSTVTAAAWALRRPGQVPAQASDGSKTNGSTEAVLDRAVSLMEKSAALATTSAGAEGRPASPNTSDTQPATIWGPPSLKPGPSAAGDHLYAQSEQMPAEEAPQSFRAGAIGDMRIGGAVGPDQIVRQGKFLDCASINEIRADLVDSPVIAMVSRDFVSLDGKYVLIPAGSKLLGEAGRVQNLQQSRVYLKFDRVIFPDQRTAYFPRRQVPAVDQAGAVGVAGDVDRHFMLQFGAAVMLGMLDGLAAVAQSPAATASPTMRDLVMARTSANFSNVLAGVLNRYANVVPTVSVPPGSKMKVFFAEDVRLSPYMATADLSWIGGRP